MSTKPASSVELVARSSSKRPHGSLSLKIAASLGGLLILLAMGVSRLTYEYTRRDAFDEKNALVDVMTYTLETTLADAPRATLQRVVENCSTLAGIKKIVILDRSGTVIASSERLDIGARARSAFTFEFIKDARRERGSHLSDETFVLLQPLRGRSSAGGPEGDIVGVAEVTLRLDTIEHAASEKTNTLLGVSLGSYVILSVGLALVLRRLVTRPVGNLADAADKLRRGERRQKVKIDGRDEIATLAESFDAMADQIDAMVSGLEKEVAARTADLSAERQALTRETELLELSGAVTATANETASVEEAFSAALDAICRVARWSAGHIYLTAKDAPSRVVPTKIQRLGDDERLHPLVLGAEPQPRGVGLAGRVLETAKPVFLGDTPDARFTGASASKPSEACAAVAFPILIGPEVAGVMEFFSAQRTPPDARLMEVMANLGAQLGRVLERQKVEQMKDEFVSTVSHELRTPLTAIRGSLGLLRHGVLGELPADAAEVVEIANESCERLVRLVNDILDVQKLAAGMMEMRQSPQPIGPLLQKAISAGRAYADAFGVTLSLDDRSEGRLVHIDSDRIEQVLTNLLSNAAKFSPQGAAVSLVALRKEGAVRVEVSDRGPGIPEAFRARIFQRFSQGDGSTTRHKDGTGLGLGISKAIVEKLGGKIGFVDREGGGTTFYFELPEATLDA